MPEMVCLTPAVQRAAEELAKKRGMSVSKLVTTLILQAYEDEFSF